MDDNLVVKESTYDSVTLSEQLDESSSSRNGCSRSGNETRSFDNESSSLGNDAYADIRPSYDNDIVSEIDQTLRMLLPKEDNVITEKQGFGFENQNDVVNPSLLNKAKELAPSLYNIDEIGKDMLSDHTIISEEELKCEAEKHLKVKQKIFPLSYHGFVYGETQFEAPPKVPLKRRNVNLKKHLEQAQLSNYDPKLWKTLLMKYFCYVKQAMLKFKKENVSTQNPPRENVFINSSFEDNVKRIARNRLSKKFKPLVKDINLQLNCFEKGLTKEMKDDLKYVTSLEDEFHETCLILDIQQEFFKTQFELVKLESQSHVYENEIFKQNSSLENENSCLKKTITELSKQVVDVKEEMTK
ncbi:hypothetical protein Tco_0780091 [Tanacetum coccineum]